jgi:hypothetical protein
MFYKRMLIGGVLVLLGVVFIIYAIPSGTPVEGAEDWVHKMGHFFQTTWDKITGHKEEKVHKYTAKSIAYVIGGILLVLGGGVLILRGIFNKK